MSPAFPELPAGFWAPARRPPLRVLAGFDGFVDTLVRVVRDRAPGGPRLYRDIPEFARELLSRAGRSGGFELAFHALRPGGNAPLMSLGLSALGCSVDCVGALGLPEPDPAFEPLARAGCGRFSVAPAARTLALEFDDGKLMLNDVRAFEGLGWEALETVLGPERMDALLKGRDLLALLGWANMPRATELWGGLLGRLRALPPGERPRRCFVDLADISRAEAPDLLSLAELLRAFQTLMPVALGLNENEALKLAGRLGVGDGDGALAPLTRELWERLGLDLVVVHPRQGACVAHGQGVDVVPGRLVERPVLSTGGGDHFNAGFCLGWMRGLEPLQAAGLGARVSALYVERGAGPRLEDFAPGAAA